MFTLVTGDLEIVGRWRAVCVTALQRPNSDAAAIRIVVGIAAASLSVTTLYSNSGIRDQLLTYKITAESAQSEHAALLVKNTALQAEDWSWGALVCGFSVDQLFQSFVCVSCHKISDLKKRLAAKDAHLQEIKEELEKYKERCARQLSQMQTLKEHIKDYDHTTSEKAELNMEIHSHRRENKELNDRIKELENRLRLHLIEREKAEQKSSGLGKRLHEAVERLSSCLSMNIKEHEDPLDALVLKVEKLMKEHKLHKSRISSLEDALACQQVESKASRDTIVKLVAETEKHKKAAAGFPAELQSLKRERDDAVLSRKNNEREKEILQEKLKENHKEWGSFRQELMEKEKKINDLERTLHSSDYETKASHSLHQSFISQLATILTKGFTTVPRTEEAVKERIQKLCSEEQTWRSTCEDLQQKIVKLNKQVEKQLDLYQEAAAKSYKAEELLQEQQNSMKHLKGKLVSEEMIKDGFNTERKRLKKFLLQLAEKMKISQDISSESLVSQYDMLLNRADEICKRDKEFLSDNKTLIYNLQKKRYDNDVDRCSVAVWSLESCHTDSSPATNDPEVPGNQGKHRVTKRRAALSNPMVTLVTSVNEKVDHQKKTIELLSKSLEKLEKIKEKAAKKVVSLKTELDYTEHESVGEKVRCQQMVEAVTNELHTAKRALEEVARREKQLVDFRETITRMMGFNINTLAVPDYEIFDQLKRVLRTNGPIDNTKTDRSKLPYGFRTGNGEPEYTVQHMNPKY
ncbi:unnamed protein product [Ranitomeya imitator]|uniref:Uncharacterized protein n=1 Tax=Ranitomeya imitator TaxID=111125 RepID=A0ABN9L4U1_9NEOB|nr:unnamed protein product [Ranitomeya imitator]